MKKLILLFVIGVLFSCGKDDPEPQMKLDYPLKYVLGDFEPGELKIYKINEADFESIAISGYFIESNMYLDMEHSSQETKDEVINFKTVELLDGTNAKVEFELATGERLDTILTYVENTNQIQFFDGSIAFLTFETTDDNSFLRFKFPTHWATYTDDSGDWNYTPFHISDIDPDSDEEWIQSVLAEYNDRSFVSSVDTIALKYSSYIYPLEE